MAVRQRVLLLLWAGPRVVRGLECSSQQLFAADDPSVELPSGVAANLTLCPRHWSWFRLAVKKEVSIPVLMEDEGVWYESPTTETMDHAAAISLDAAYDYTSGRYSTLAMLVVDGLPPSVIATSEPYSTANYAGTYHVYERFTDRETITFGFDDGYALDACQKPLAGEFVYIGVRCITPYGGDPCSFTLSGTALPHRLYHGLELDAFIKPDFPVRAPSLSRIDPPRHYFKVRIGAYESMQMTLERIEEPGAPLRDASGASLGRGLAGGVYIAPGTDSCPSSAALTSDALDENDALVETSTSQQCEIGLNDTEACVAASFCTESLAETMEYVIGIESVVSADRPTMCINAAKSSYATNEMLEDGCTAVTHMVGPEGVRTLTSAVPGAEGELPRWNDPKNFIVNRPNDWTFSPETRNDLKHERARYRLRVSQLSFSEGALRMAEGAMVNGELRPGCVSYGQWRYYSVQTSGANDAAISVVASEGIGMLLVRADAKPTMREHGALARRRVDGGSVRATLTPCDPSVPTLWHVAVAFEERALALASGFLPVDFNLSVRLSTSVMSAEGGTVAPAADDFFALESAVVRLVLNASDLGGGGGTGAETGTETDPDVLATPAEGLLNASSLNASSLNASSLNGSSFDGSSFDGSSFDGSSVNVSSADGLADGVNASAANASSSDLNNANDLDPDLDPSIDLIITTPPLPPLPMLNTSERNRTAEVGVGFVCCGAIKYHLIRNIPGRMSLRVSINVTKGTARALWLKHASCPTYPDDVDGLGCAGRCVVSWLTTYDPYDGAALSHHSDVALVPNGLGLDDDRRGYGDWLVGVQALDGDEAEYLLESTLVEPPREDDTFVCDRWQWTCPRPVESSLPSQQSEYDGRYPSIALFALASTWCFFRRVFHPRIFGNKGSTERAMRREMRRQALYDYRG